MADCAHPLPMSLNSCTDYAPTTTGHLAWAMPFYPSFPALYQPACTPYLAIGIQRNLFFPIAATTCHLVFVFHPASSFLCLLCTTSQTQRTAHPQNIRGARRTRRRNLNLCKSHAELPNGEICDPKSRDMELGKHF